LQTLVWRNWEKPRRTCIVIPEGIKKYGKIMYEKNKEKRYERIENNRTKMRRKRS
jgi:hypothetical protein